MANHDIEHIAMNDEIGRAIRSHMDRILDHFDAAEMRAVIVAQELVMVARNIDHAGALARLAQELLHDVIMGLWPIPARFQLPAIDDVANQINGVGIVIAQKVEELIRLAAFRAKMDIGQEKRPNPIGWLGRVKHQQCYPPS